MIVTQEKQRLYLGSWEYNAAPSQIRRERKRQRVPNTYNSGYHYETVFEPERFARIDF